VKTKKRQRNLGRKIVKVRWNSIKGGSGGDGDAFVATINSNPEAEKKRGKPSGL